MDKGALSVAEKPSETRLATCYGGTAKRSPHKKGGEQEIMRIRKLRSDPIARFKISALTGKVLASYRDRRLKGDGQRQPVTRSTVNRELTLISHVLNVAPCCCA